MLFSSQAYAAAFNALLAEHDLGYVELVRENPFAGELKDGIMSALRSGDRTPYDAQYWEKIFNSSSRILQLNFIVYGFNELHMKPMLPGEDWMPIRNPFAINNIEGKIEKASRLLARRHRKMFQLRRSKFSLQGWGLEDLSYQKRPDLTENNEPEPFA